MYPYSKSGQAMLKLAHPAIRLVANGISNHRNSTVVSTLRSYNEQHGMFLKRPKVTNVDWPDSQHTVRLNPDAKVSDDSAMLSRAIDIIPYPTTQEDWGNRLYWIEWSSWVKGYAQGRGVYLVSGYDWNNDYNYDIDNQTFWDGPHFQLEKGFEL